MEQRDDLAKYVKENRDRLERTALYGNKIASAMALAVLEKVKSKGD